MALSKFILQELSIDLLLNLPRFINTAKIETMLIMAKRIYQYIHDRGGVNSAFSSDISMDQSM